MNRKILTLKNKPLSKTTIKKQAFDHCMKLITETYPVFSKHLPLAIGIHRQIINDQPDIPHKILSYVESPQKCDTQ